MNIRQSLEFFASNSKPVKKSRMQIAREVVIASTDPDVTIGKWSKEWLSSESFVLALLPIGRVAVPKAPPEVAILRQLNASAPGLVVVDVNKKKLCRTATGFVPQTVIIVGAEVQAAAQRQGDEMVLAWIGEKAMHHIVLSQKKKTIAASNYGGAKMNLKETMDYYGAGDPSKQSPGSGVGPRVKDKLPPKSEQATHGVDDNEDDDK